MNLILQKQLIEVCTKKGWYAQISHYPKITLKSGEVKEEVISIVINDFNTRPFETDGGELIAERKLTEMLNTLSSVKGYTRFYGEVLLIPIGNPPIKWRLSPVVEVF
jgi:hypothetical protein